MKVSSYVGAACLAVGRAALQISGSLAVVAEPLLGLAERSGTAEAEGWLCLVRGMRAARGGNDAAALAHLRAAARLLPDESNIAVALALAFANAGEWELAVESGERALKFYEEANTDQQLWQMLAWGYLITGRYPYALDLLLRMRDTGLDSFALHLPMILARAVVFGQDPPIDQVRLGLRRNPRVVEPYWRLVEHVALTGKGDLATRLLSLLPTTTALAAALAIARRAADDDHAEQVLWVANSLRRLELAPQMALATGALAALVALDLPQALSYSEQALEMGPDEPVIHERRALVLFLAGDEDGARGEASNALQLGSADALCGALVATGMIADGKARDAQAIFRTQRYGDALGVFLGSLVQGWIEAECGDGEKAGALLGVALAETERLAQWQRRPVVRERAAEIVRAIGASGAAGQVEEPLGRIGDWLELLPAE